MLLARMPAEPGGTSPLTRHCVCVSSLTEGPCALQVSSPAPAADRVLDPGLSISGDPHQFFLQSHQHSWGSLRNSAVECGWAAPGHDIHGEWHSGDSRETMALDD